jgi:hypothetical protein
MTPFCSSLLQVTPTSTWAVYKTPAAWAGVLNGKTCSDADILGSIIIAITLPNITVHGRGCTSLEIRNEGYFGDWEDLVPPALAGFPSWLVSKACSVLIVKSLVVVTITKKAPTQTVSLLPPHQKVF